MGREYLGGSGTKLTFWISATASTVLVFYGYDQVSEQAWHNWSLSKLISFISIDIGSVWERSCQREFP